MDLEAIDLAALAEDLRQFFYEDPPVGYLRGRTVFRDAIAQRLGCSVLEAETLVETMESMGYLHFSGDPSRRSEADAPWDFGRAP